MSSSTSNRSKAAALARVLALIAGLQKHFPSGSFTIGNVAYSTSALVGVIKGLADALAALATARANAKDALANVKTQAATVDPVIAGLEKQLESMFAGAAQNLADFGIEPPKARQPMSAEVLAARKAKARATRAKRGTLGPKAKQAIKGDVTGVQIIPVTSPEASPPAQSASNASSAPTGATK
jgi:hypothetical protein